jgi:hypothetical protein
MRERAVAGRIVALGFRRWHERLLVIAHVWLAACFIAMVCVAAGLELSSIGSGLADFLFDALVIGSTGVFGVHAWRRYRETMQLADAIESQAVCPGCGRFGFSASIGDGARLNADCRQCGTHWIVDTGQTQ